MKGYMLSSFWSGLGDNKKREGDIPFKYWNTHKYFSKLPPQKLLDDVLYFF